MQGAVEEEGFELIDVLFPRFKSKHLVRIFIDKEGGVTVSDCRRVSARVGEILDIEDPFPTRYTLEVSSPGVDRPLETVRDFQRNVGRTLRVSMSRDDHHEVIHSGVLKDVQNETLFLETEKEKVQIPLRYISKAQVCVSLKK